MCRFLNSRVVQIIAILLLTTAGARTISAQQGNVTTLPPDKMSTQLESLHETIVEAAEELKNENVRAYVEAYQQMVQQYSIVADLIGDSAEASGEMSVRLQLLAASLKNVDSTTPVDPEQRQALLRDVGAIRSDLVGRLQLMHSQYREASMEFKPQLKQKLAGLVLRIEQMQSLENSLSEGTGPVVPGYAMSQFNRQLSDMTQVLQEERDSLNVVAKSVRLLVTSNAGQMRRSLEMLNLQQRLPVEQFRQLQQSQQEVRDVMSRLDASHRKVSAAVVDILAAQAAAEPIDEVDLQQRIDRLLGGQRPSLQSETGQLNPLATGQNESDR